MAKYPWEINLKKETSRNSNPFIQGNKKSRTKKEKPEALKKSLRDRYWKGKWEGPCFCCGKRITFEEFHLGRIKAGGPYVPNNVRLICMKCNADMHTTNMKSFMKRYYPERYERTFGKENKKKKATRKARTQKQSNSLFP